MVVAFAGYSLHDHHLYRQTPFFSPRRSQHSIMALRAEKSGFAREAQQKTLAKYDADIGHQVLEWIKEVSAQDIDTNGEMNAFCETLQSGVVLCNLANSLQSGSVKKISQSQQRFIQNENINSFLNFVGKAGVAEHDRFQTIDLYEKVNPNQVLICLSALTRNGEKFGVRSLGPKEATAKPRDFTEEQLRAGEGVIGLQAGQNKGATQAGLNIGNTRHI